MMQYVQNLVSWYLGQTEPQQNETESTENVPFHPPLVKNKYISLPLPSPAYVTSMCTWNEFIVTSGQSELNVWTQNGEFVCDARDSRFLLGIYPLTQWKDWLITANTIKNGCKIDQELALWQMTRDKSSNKIDIKCVQVLFRSFLAVIFRDMLLTRAYGIELWNENISMIQRVHVPKKSWFDVVYVQDILVVDEFLWAGTTDGNINQWRIMPDGKMFYIKAIAAHETPGVQKLCAWNNWVVSASCDSTLKVWGMDGANIFTFHVQSDARTQHCLTQWMDKLVCATINQSFIYIWNQDGSLYQTMESSPVMSLLACGDKLWQGGNNELRVWLPPREWRIERILWIGWMKNPECPLSLLPNHIVSVIIGFVHGH